MKFEFNADALTVKIRGISDHKIIPRITQEALKDANALCKRQTGNLAESAITNSDIEHGLLIWQTPYARRQYYTGEPKLNKNDRAVTMWAHKAAEANMEKYQRMAQALADGEAPT